MTDSTAGPKQRGSDQLPMQTSNPDPRRPYTYSHRQVCLPGGNTYHLVDQYPARDEAGHITQHVRGTCLLLHGFPDLWYGWRYQILALSNAGFRCIVPSCLGYGESSKPDDIKQYAFKALSADLYLLLKQLGVDEQILLLGHDWGGALAWRFAAYYPDQVKAICVISTPYPPPAQLGSKWVDLQSLVDTKLPNFGYQVFFASDEAPKIIESRLDIFLEAIFAPSSQPSRVKPEPSGSDTVSWTRGNRLKERLQSSKLPKKQQHPERDEQAEKSYYLSVFAEHGLTYPLFYYRTRRLNYCDEIDSRLPLQFPSRIPAFYITGDRDDALPLAMSDGSNHFFAAGQYQRTVLSDADHWLLQRPSHRDIVTTLIVKWAVHNCVQSRL